jgi:hypothetical protein
MRWEHDIVLNEQVTVQRRVVEMRHTLAFDGLHETRLRDTRTLERDYASIQMG